jgi:hypothetical protein
MILPLAGAVRNVSNLLRDRYSSWVVTRNEPAEEQKHGQKAEDAQLFSSESRHSA